MYKGYEDAIILAQQKLDALNPIDVCGRSGVKHENGVYIIPWLGDAKRLDELSGMEKVLCLHYLTSDGTKKPTGKHISFRDVNKAGFYEPIFTARAIRPLIKRFGTDTSGFVSAGEKLRGVPFSAGDAAVTINVLPNLPISYIIWIGDDEMPANASILFDETAPRWLPAEDLVVAASLGTYKMLKG